MEEWSRVESAGGLVRVGKKPKAKSPRQLTLFIYVRKAAGKHDSEILSRWNLEGSTSKQKIDESFLFQFRYGVQKRTRHGTCVEPGIPELGVI